MRSFAEWGDLWSVLALIGLLLGLLLVLASLSVLATLGIRRKAPLMVVASAGGALGFLLAPVIAYLEALRILGRFGAENMTGALTIPAAEAGSVLYLTSGLALLLLAIAVARTPSLSG